MSEPQDRERAAFEAYCKTLSVWKQAEIPTELCYEFWQAARREERKRCAEIVGHELADDSSECRPLCPACRLQEE